MIQIPVYSNLLFPVYLLVGLAVYLMMLRALRAVRKEEVDLIRGYLWRFGSAAQIIARILL